MIRIISESGEYISLGSKDMGEPNFLPFRCRIRPFASALLVILSICLQAGCGSTKTSQNDPTQIRARKLILEDANAVPRLQLEVDGKIARTEILDPNGACRIRLQVDEAGQPSICLLHPDGTVQFGISDVDGATRLVVNNRDGGTQFSLDVSDKDGVAMAFLTKDGQPRINLDVTPEGEGRVQIRDAAGKTVFVSPR